MEQVFFIADFHLGDHDVFTKDENGRRMNVNVAVRDNWRRGYRRDKWLACRASGREKGLRLHSW